MNTLSILVLVTLLVLPTIAPNINFPMHSSAILAASKRRSATTTLIKEMPWLPKVSSCSAQNETNFFLTGKTENDCSLDEAYIAYSLLEKKTNSVYECTERDKYYPNKYGCKYRH
jgi:hypothetical protein